MTQWAIRLLDDGDAISEDGEVLGTWGRDDEDHPFFIPAGETEALFWETSIPGLCDKIERWWRERA